MAADRIPVPAFGLTRLARLGLDVGQLLRHAGISPALLQQPLPFLSTRRYFALWRSIEALSGDALIGLRLGGEASVDQFDPASVAALHSDHFAQALQRLARYKRLSCPEEIRIETAGDETRISFRWPWVPGPAPAALTDAAFANVHLLLRSGTGRAIPPLRVALSRTAVDLVRYRRHFGCEVALAEAQDALVYPSATLAEPFVTGNPALLTALLPGLDQQLAAAAPERFDRQVKAVLMQMMRGERPSIEATARHLCMSPRSLQRRLTEAHTSYQSLPDEVRLETACRLLGETDMAPGEIAFHLGFEEINSFQRAFHKWQGLTPRQWRTARAAAPVAP